MCLRFLLRIRVTAVVAVTIAIAMIAMSVKSTGVWSVSEEAALRSMTILCSLWE